MAVDFKRTRLCLGLMGAFGGVLLSAGGASAQQATPAPTQQLDRVEITGSNIRRLEGETVSPVEVITREEMVRSGYTSVSEVLANVTANNNGLLSQSFSRGFAGGASGVSLRGLGVGATLVLIDGLRMASYALADDAQRPFVDTSSIPFDSVDRIEVLLDGASAIYGSDAIGGVVNIILRKNYTGTLLTADAGTTTEGDGTTYRFALTQGFGSSTTPYSGFVNFEYRKSEEILLKDRDGDWTTMDWRPFNGRDLRGGAVSLPTTSPFIQTPYLQRPGGSINDPANYAFLGTGCNFTALRASQCVFEDNWSQIKPETENFNFTGRLNWKFNPAWEGSLTGSYYRSDAQQTILPRTLPAGSQAGVAAVGIGQTPTLVPAITPYTVPATYPGNTLGEPGNVRAFNEPNASGRLTEFETGATRLVAQLNGQVGTWNLNVAAGYTEVETDITYNRALNPSALLAALNDPTNPFLLAGGTDPAVYNAAVPIVENTVKSELSFGQVTASTDLAQLAGGPLGFATGLSYIYRSLYAPNPPGVNTGQIIGPTNAYAAGSQNNWAAYAEINAPVLKNLELSAALRYDDYDTYGGQLVPKVGAKFTPIPQLTIRGTYSEGFRAPSINESVESGAGFNSTAQRDPLLCPVSNPDGTPNVTAPQNVPAFCGFNVAFLQQSNPNLEAEESKNWNFGLVLEPIPRWLTTIDYYNIEVKNQIINAQGLSTFDPFATAVRSGPVPVTFGDGSTGLSPVGPVAYTVAPFVNAQQVEVSGIDFATSYTFQLPEANAVTVGLRWSHTLKYDITLEGTTFELAGTHGPEIVSGNTGNPKNRGQLLLGWARGPFTVTGTLNYIGSYDNTDPSVGIDTCDQAIFPGTNGTRYSGVSPTLYPRQFCKVESFTYVNLNAQWQVTKQLLVQLSGQNIFNEKPPVDMLGYAGTGVTTNSGTGTPYNPSLHNAGAIGPFYSIGARYSF